VKCEIKWLRIPEIVSDFEVVGRRGGKIAVGLVRKKMNRNMSEKRDARESMRGERMNKQRKNNFTSREQ
jgi:hypothetical protein